MKPFPVSPESRESLEHAAVEILVDFDPEMLKRPKALDVERLVDTYMSRKYEWDLDVQEQLPPNIEAYTDPKTKSVVLPAETHQGLGTDGRARFTATHEFVHVAKHGKQLRMRMMAFDEKSDHAYRKTKEELKPYVNPEWQANYMAGALLMPAGPAMKIYRDCGWNKEIAIKKMMAMYLVSYSAAKTRVDYLDKKRPQNEFHVNS